MPDLPEYIGEQRKTHRYVSKLLLYQLCFILFDISKFHLQEVFLLSRLKDHYYVYSALLQMVEMLLNERTLDCICKKKHAKKMACVFEAIRKVDYMLWWVVSNFVYSRLLTNLTLIEFNRNCVHNGFDYISFHHSYYRSGLFTCELFVGSTIVYRQYSLIGRQSCSIFDSL